jgi:hypothetical protein
MAEVTHLHGFMKAKARDRRAVAVVAPRPTQGTALLKSEDVEQMRSLFCPRYDDCLDRAVSGGWASWTCTRCQLFGLANESKAVDAAYRAALRTAYDGQLHLRDLFAASDALP